MDANGVQENRVAKAKELIAQQNYNDAILILTQVVREEPDRQDEAQELISQIVRARNQYNTDYESLINLLYVKKDEATALKVIAQLEAIDKNPNKQTQDDIRQAKRTARLIANNKRYRDIMDRALVLLNRREYGAAIQVYLEGDDLAKDAFLESDFGNVINNQVDRTWADLRAAAALFVQAETRLKTLPAQGTALLASETFPNPAFDGLLSTTRELAAWRQRAWGDGRQFKAQNDFLVKNGRQEDFFLGYSYLFVNGPADAKTPEGILGAMERMWSEVLDPWVAQIRSGVETRYTQAKDALDRGDAAAAAAAFQGLRVRSRQGLDSVALWNRLSGIDQTGTLDPWYRTKLTQILPVQVWLDHRLTLALQGLQAAQFVQRETALAQTNTTDRTVLDQARAEVRTHRETLGRFVATTGGWTAQNQSLASLGLPLVEPTAFGTEWQTIWTGVRRQALAQESNLVDKRGNLDYGLLNTRFQGLQTSLTEAQDQVEGRLKYPLQASAKLEELAPTQAVLSRDLTSFIALYDGEPGEVKTSAVQRWPILGRTLLDRLNAAQTLQGQLLATARANYAQSQALRKQGQDLLPQIDSFVSAENFTQARAVLNQASTRYSQSLALQEDPTFRNESDDQVKSLFDRILKAENEVVVRDVRRLITQGSSAYLSQQFTQAEQVLTRARNRWATTNSDPNPEVEYWLTLASYALSVTTGRELSPIDPLYNEVQQLLNFARRDFTLGQDKMGAGDQEGGLESMKQAKDILSKILVPFPLNQEARILNLEILKASDPANFPTLFQQNFDAAVTRINTEPNIAYNDLLDLDKIQPNSPGMDAAIKQVRRKLGLDREPVDNTALAQARTLVAQAARLVAGGSQNQLAQAQSLIRQALQRDPANTTAQALNDQISLLRTPTVGTKTPTILGELAEIQDLLRSQRTLEALSRINEFKARYPNLVNDTQVRELDRRIRAVN